MILREWEQLPPQMQNAAVKEYYEILRGKRGSLALKRGFDIFASVLLILLTSPVFLVLAVWIKRDSPGPVFYRQERITQYGKPFRIFKFRTMRVDADKTGALVTTKGDTRITRVGRKIRSTRLDELPQLFNVFSGNMSFVGTRPEVRKYVDTYTEQMWATLLLPAGITSEASILYKDESELLDGAEDPDAVYIGQVLPDKMRYNLYAIRHFSFWFEIRTMFRTVFAVLGKECTNVLDTDNG